MIHFYDKNRKVVMELSSFLLTTNKNKESNFPQIFLTPFIKRHEI